MNSQGEICKLPQSLIDKISAGEVIQKPYNVVKELIENSLDAESTNINIIAKEAGLRSLRITDDGKGIKKEDFFLLCSRYATSKIKSYHDLCGVTTFGFRGEALASISNVSTIIVNSRRREYDHSFSARYDCGKMVNSVGQPSESPQISTGNEGTQITVENMFKNDNIRKSQFKNWRDEYAKIVSLCGKYGIQFCGRVQFTLKRDVDSVPDIITKNSDNLMSIIESVFNIKGKEYLKEFSDENNNIGVVTHGVASVHNFNYKKYLFFMFINDRLVDCNPLKAAILNVYSRISPPVKYPFYYISIRIDPVKIDVNVHPTKQEVIFLNQTKIISYIQEFTETLIKEITCSNVINTPKQSTLIENIVPHHISSTPIKSEKNPSRTVRIDYRDQPLDSFIQNTSGLSISLDDSKMDISSSGDVCTISVTKQPRVLPLINLRILKEDIHSNSAQDLYPIFQKFKFIGPVDPNRILLQFDVNLYLIDCFKLFSELFYQIIMHNFGSFNYWKLSVPISLHSIKDISSAKLLSEVIHKNQMLTDYFSIIIDNDGNLTHIIQILRNFPILPTLIPRFIHRLATTTDWTDEQKCLEGVSRTIAWFYSTNLVSLCTKYGHDYSTKLYNNELLPLVRNFYIPQKNATYDGTITLLTSVPDLYKIFERC